MSKVSSLDPAKRFRPRVLWRDGAPTARGLYWVVFRGEPVVELVSITPAWIYRDIPDAPLQMQICGGLAYRLAGNEQLFERHAIAWPPQQPGPLSGGRDV